MISRVIEESCLGQLQEECISASASRNHLKVYKEVLVWFSHIPSRWSQQYTLSWGFILEMSSTVGKSGQNVYPKDRGGCGDSRWSDPACQSTSHHILLMTSSNKYMSVRIWVYTHTYKHIHTSERNTKPYIIHMSSLNRYWRFPKVVYLVPINWIYWWMG